MNCWNIEFEPSYPKIYAHEHINFNGSQYDLIADCNVTTAAHNDFECVEEGIEYEWYWFWVNTDYNRAIAYNKHFKSLNFYSRYNTIEKSELDKMIKIAEGYGYEMTPYNVQPDNTKCKNEIVHEESLADL
eukprot:CAMPEP_0114575258 /NCGR_PEP_ID=MMETSP0125-20121206/155_1 /TAXON_ID=485358 ORGANISM="Aristerostoma sp., Strain ATCC 50986" /NCGR_SAMPLE_ID=MMETSP0125 /ASSEMBLY_ACC=CAM_ASM_000245 /LENGTH=130 /DNA_ID=CAMNT_0001762863 /DNA_START=197 /DNA_END=589 /DNA_ORIENTATION=-